VDGGTLADGDAKRLFGSPRLLPERAGRTLPWRKGLSDKGRTAENVPPADFSTEEPEGWSLGCTSC
jgi:hypothetical protein